jgi:molybdate transport repressor ModE-like protein
MEARGMSARPRLVHKPRLGERTMLQREAADAGRSPPADRSAPYEVWPGAAGARDAMREVQMENIHPLRLRLLLEIERTRSISAAAQACGIGQPSASMHIRNLEATLGHRLVTRNGRGSSLTAAGKVVASHGAQMLATLDSMRRAVDALGERGAGELTIAASVTPSVVLLGPILRELSERYPGVTVRLRTLPSEAVAHAVARGQAEVGIAGDILTADTLVRRRIVVDELVGIAPPGAFEADHGWITIGQLAHNRLLLGPEGSSTRIITEHHLACAGYRPATLWEFNSYETVIRMVRQGLGVSFVSRLLVCSEVEREELNAFCVSGVEQMLRPIYALHHPARHLSPEVSAFMGLLADARCAAPVRHASRAQTSGPHEGIGSHDTTHRLSG